jgi:hypothetical protein
MVVFDGSGCSGHEMALLEQNWRSGALFLRFGGRLSCLGG